MLEKSHKRSGPAVVGTGAAALPQYDANAEALAEPFPISAIWQAGPIGALLAYERNAIETKIRAAGASSHVALGLLPVARK